MSNIINVVFSSNHADMVKHNEGRSFRYKPEHEPEFKLDDVEFYTTQEDHQGISPLIIVDSNTNKIIDKIDEALLHALPEKFGDGIYAESCGGYAGSIHMAWYLSDDNDYLLTGHNINSYECHCDECDELGYKESTCERKDWTQIDEYDYDAERECLTKLYSVDMSYIVNHDNSSGDMRAQLSGLFGEEVIDEEYSCWVIDDDQEVNED